LGPRGRLTVPAQLMGRLLAAVNLVLVGWIVLNLGEILLIKMVDAFEPVSRRVCKRDSLQIISRKGS